jgi:hypothetical protein
MTNPRLSFGEMTILGELAIWPPCCDPADELTLRIALALGQPPDEANQLPPPFATVPVLLDGQEIGQMLRIQYAPAFGLDGCLSYEFRSTSGRTRIIRTDRDAVVERLMEVLQLAG